MEHNTGFNQRIGGRLFTSEQDLISELHNTLELLCGKQGLDKQQLIDAARSVQEQDTAEWEVLISAVGGAQTMSRKNRECAVSRAYNGTTETTVADGSCSKCDGSGKYVFSSGAVGVCYQCSGTGKD